MIKMNGKKFEVFVSLGVLIISFVLISGCVNDDNTDSAQIIKDITTAETYDLIKNNTDNPNFIIIDVRSSESFADGYIENAINLYYESETFNEDINEFDRNHTYLIYCQIGYLSRLALDDMDELGFMEAYNMLGGTDQWGADGYPLVT